MKRQPTRKTPSTAGNALWFILIAVALLGILSALLVRTSSETEETGDTERASIYASEMLNYMAGIQSAVTAIMSRGCSESQISFWYDSNGDGIENGSDDYFNSTSPSDKSCHVFDTAGGGMTWKIPPAQIMTPGPDLYFKKYFFVSGTAYNGIGTTCTDPSCSDLLIGANINSKATCRAINSRLGIAGIPTDTDFSSSTFYGHFFDESQLAEEAGGEAASGKKGACFEKFADNYFIAFVVLAR